METQTQTNQNHRELTKTEIKIASAQIEDRLERILAAQRELDRLSCGQGKYARIHKMPEEQYGRAFNDVRKKILDKYEIPRGVYAFYQGDADFTRDKSALRGLFKMIPHFVAGALTEGFIDHHLIYRCLEIDELDYGWVFLDCPMFFYGDRMEIPPTSEEEELSDIVRIRKELINIGTRSKNKWAGMAAYPASYISGVKSTAGITNSVIGEVLGIN